MCILYEVDALRASQVERCEDFIVRQAIIFFSCWLGKRIN